MCARPVGAFGCREVFGIVIGIVIQPRDDAIGDTSDLLGEGVAICSRLGRVALWKNRSGAAGRAHARVAGAVGGDAGNAT